MMRLLLAVFLLGAANAAHAFDYQLKPRQIAQNTWVVEGANADFSRSNGCNIINVAFIATGAGVVVINTGPSKSYGEQLRKAIARVTQENVREVWNLNLHPDYFFGNQAFAGVPLRALPGTLAGAKAEGGAYADNLYRMCGDALTGTEPTPATQELKPGDLNIGKHRFTLTRMSGHTGDDLVVLDQTTGVAFIGGLVFAQRVPTTPHADIDRWLKALDAVAALPAKTLVFSHGPLSRQRDGIEDTRRYLQWLDKSFKASAAKGLEPTEVLRLKPPPGIDQFAAWPDEFVRNVAHLYARYEAQAMQK